jgi:hypothetical protein
LISHYLDVLLPPRLLFFSGNSIFLNQIGIFFIFFSIGRFSPCIILSNE